MCSSPLPIRVSFVLHGLALLLLFFLLVIYFLMYEYVFFNLRVSSLTYGIRLIMQRPNYLYLHRYRYCHASLIFILYNRFPARLCILPIFFGICFFCVIYIYIIYICRFCLTFVVFVLCSRWSLADIPLILSRPAEQVLSDWQPRTLLCIVEARSMNVQNTNTHTNTRRDAKMRNKPQNSCTRYVGNGGDLNGNRKTRRK